MAVLLTHASLVWLLTVTNQSHILLISPISCKFTVVATSYLIKPLGLKNWLLTVSLPYRIAELKHLHVVRPTPPAGLCQQFARVWKHNFLICYRFKTTICQLSSMKKANVGDVQALKGFSTTALNAVIVIHFLSCL